MSSSRRTASRIFLAGVAVLLAGMIALLITSARTESQTVDEGAHLAAGYSYWKTGDFRLNPEHPPLVKLIASVPLLFLPIHLPVDQSAWENRDQWTFARQLIYRNTVDADVLLFAGRLPIMALAVLLGLMIAIWARRLWGAAGGLLALTVFVLDPTVLAHSRYITTDIGVALAMFCTIFLFGRFLERPTILRWLPVAVLFAAAQLSKFSATILWVILPLLWLLHQFAHLQSRNLSFRRALLFFASLVGTTYLAAFVSYGFEFAPPLRDPQFAAIYDAEEIWQPSLADEQPWLAKTVLHLTRPDSPFGSGLRSAFATVPLPAYTYFRGLSQVVWHNYWGHSSYLLGDYRSTGWWYYFPVAFLVKTPYATLILFALTAVYLLRLLQHRHAVYRTTQPTRWRRIVMSYRSADFSYTLLLVPVIVYFVFSCTSKINLGVRHLLPIYPFLFVLTGSLVTVKFRRIQRWWRATLAAIVVVLAVSNLIAFPHYLSYFSEMVGGSNSGARYLTDSNLDWGQELRRLGAFLERHDIPFVHILYFGQAPLERYLKDFRYLPTSQQPGLIEQLDGWAAISATALMNPSGDYDWLRSRVPTAKIGGAIFLYDLRKSPAPSPLH